MDDRFPPNAPFSRQALLEAVKQGEGRFGKRELARALNLSGEDRIALKEALRGLVEEGVLAKAGKREYALAASLPPVMVLEVRDRDVDGEMLCRPARDDLDDVPPIRLAPGEGDGRSGRAVGIGDRVLARLSPDGEGGYEAKLIKRLGRSAHKILCVLRKGRGGARLVPVDRRAKQELLPAKGEAEKADDNDLVICRLSSERRYGLKTAVIEEVIGSADSPRAGSVIALAEHGVPQGFSEAEAKETKTVKPARPEGREDLTDIPLITIDPEDARDHDDAVFAAPDPDPGNRGGWVVWVAIADVAAYVAPDAALDKGARKRGVSVYLPDRVIPMLPERLSNDLCSLREGEDRPCLAIQMVFDKSGQKKRHKVVRGWMRSAAKLSYEEAQAAIDGRGKGRAEALKADVLEPLWGAYRALKAARDRREPLEIDAPERKVKVGEDGAILSIDRRERFDAHKLIEEFMIQANVAAAELLEAKRRPLIYRIHEQPGEEKLEALADFLPTIGLSWAKAERPTPARFNRILAQAKGDLAETVNEIVLRTQSQAVYDTDNAGHFGLNLKRYAHFTSPIRRYADLTVHRALVEAYDLSGPGAQSEAERAQLQAIAEETTANERRAMAAERDAVDRFVAAYMSGREGAEFPGRITGVTRFGLFVRLEETGADGLCPIAALGEEFFEHDPAAHALIGEESGAAYRLGQPVTVRLLEATPITGGLRFEMLTPPTPGEAAPRRKRGQPKRRGGAKLERRGRSGGGGRGGPGRGWRK